MTSGGLGSGESKLETVIGYLLIAGVIISLLLEIMGIGVFYYSYGNLVVSQDKSMFIQGRNFFGFLYDFLRGEETEESAILFMTLGVVTLMLTPYIRVIASVFYFVWRKNIKYVLITLFVLVVLTITLMLH